MSVQATVICEGLPLVCGGTLSSLSRFLFLGGAMCNEQGPNVGEGSMDVVAELGVGHLEAGIVDAVAIVRGCWGYGFRRGGL